MIKPKQLKITNGKVLLGNSSNIASETAYTFPSADGNTGQFLKTDGSGSLSFATVSGGGGSSYTINVQVGSDSTQTLSYSASNNEEVYIITPTANRTITLPNIGSNSIPEGYKINIKNMSSSFSLTIQANTTGTTNQIDESSVSNHVISVQYQSLTVVCDGSTKWYRI